MTVLLLPVRPPLSLDPLRRFLAAHVVAGLERHDAGRHTRLVPTRAGPAVVTVDLTRLTDDGSLQVSVGPGSTATRPEEVEAEVHRRVERWLGLDREHAVGPADAHLADDPLLGPMVRARPGLRVPGAVDGWETALTTVLGQQVSLAAARTFAGRLLAAHGRPGPVGLRLLPGPAELAQLGADRVREATGVTGARARTLVALGQAVADGLLLEPPVGPGAAGVRAAGVTRLLGLPGVGPWTASYVALRCLRDPDAFLAGDLVVRRVLGGSAREVAARAERWSPWRSHALLHLWTAAVFS